MKKGLNQWNVIGNVGREPEMRYTTSGTAVCDFSVAINSSWKDGDGELHESVEWVNVVAWKRLAEICGEYLKKGAPVFVSGRAQTSSWEKDGVKRYKTELVADNMILLGQKGDTDSSARPEPGTDAPPAPDKDDLPF